MFNLKLNQYVVNYTCGLIIKIYFLFPCSTFESIEKTCDGCATDLYTCDGWEICHFCHFFFPKPIQVSLSCYSLSFAVSYIPFHHAYICI